VIEGGAEKRWLEETSKRLSSALDQVMEVIAILDARDGAILYSNAVFSQVFGLSSPPPCSGPEVHGIARVPGPGCRLGAGELRPGLDRPLLLEDA
jgi:PAS domain-containing protein